MKTVTKNAENKNLQTLINLFKLKTQEQKSDFMHEYVAFQQKEIDNVMEYKRTKGSLTATDEEYFNSKKESAMNQLEWLQEGQEYYDQKLQKACIRISELIDLDKFGGRPTFNSFDEDCVQSANQFDFLLTFSKLDTSFDESDPRFYEEVEVHARMIWVECYEKVSHWRFITTKRKSK